MKMEDIALLAGVSKSAVSLALSGKPGISSETRERVLEIAKNSGYVPRPRANASEHNGKSLTFLAFTNSGFVPEEYYQQPFFRELIHHIEDGCRSNGYALRFSTIHKEHFERDILAVAEDSQSDGYILLGTNLNSYEIAEVVGRLGPNLVVLDNCFDALPISCVGINNVMGAYQAGEHICKLGHQQIGYIASNIRIHNFEERRDGFSKALHAHGMTLSDEHRFAVAPTMLSSQESLKDQFRSYMQSGRKLPTAFFCECDYIAISALKTLSELNISVPEQISIVGFDNITESQIVSPELTTVHVDKKRMAQLAVEQVIALLVTTEETARVKIKVDTQFILRKSTSEFDLNN